tara:strand:- start:42635 stop:42838 length:204 start_codon:yes stop_codon:yes gene_type:complete
MNFKLGISVVIACFILIFVFQNTAIVEVKFLLWSLTMSRSLLILLFVGVGIIIGWLLKGHVVFKVKN